MRKTSCISRNTVTSGFHSTLFFISPFNLVARRASSADIVHPYGIDGHLDACFLQYRPSLTGLGGFVYRILHAQEIEWGDVSNAVGWQHFVAM